MRVLAQEEVTYYLLHKLTVMLTPAMRRQEVSWSGMVIAAMLALVGTIGHFVTIHSFNSHDDDWLLVFALAMITLCASAVNFDPKRWLR